MKNNKILIIGILSWFIISFITISIGLIIQNLNVLLVSMGQVFLFMGIYGYIQVKNKMLFVPIIIGISMISMVLLEKIMKADIFSLLILFVPFFMFIVGLFTLISSKESIKESKNNFVINTVLIVKNIEYKDEIWYAQLEYTCNGKTFKREDIFELEEEIPYKIGDNIDIVVDKTNYEDYMYLWEKENLDNRTNIVPYIFIIFIDFISNLNY